MELTERSVRAIGVSTGRTVPPGSFQEPEEEIAEPVSRDNGIRADDYQFGDTNEWDDEGTTE